MIPHKRRVIFLLVGVAAGLALAILITSQVIGLPAPHLIGAPSSGVLSIGARGPLRLTFDTPIQPESVETRLRLEPGISGKFAWNDPISSTLTFTPDQPLKPGERYTLRLKAGVRGQNGLILRQEVTWAVEVRQSEALLLSPSRSPDLWRVTADGQARKQLTFTGGKVFDFSDSPDGEHIVYSAKNEQGGIDLWEIARQGGTPRALLPCGADWCVNPAYSPDGTKIVYSRRQSSGLLGSDPGVPHVWSLDTATLSTDILIADTNMGGSQPAWALDGRYLAFIDERSSGIHVLDMQAKSAFLLPAGTGTALVWSPDSRHILYTSGQNSEEQPYVIVYVADVQTQQSHPLLGADDTDLIDYSVPSFTPDGVWMAVARRLVGGTPNKQIWLMRSDGSQRQSISKDLLSNYASYHWDPSGSRLIFQRLALGASGSLPQVQVWNRQNGKVTTLAEDAFQPQWIP